MNGTEILCFTKGVVKPLWNSTKLLSKVEDTASWPNYEISKVDEFISHIIPSKIGGKPEKKVFSKARVEYAMIVRYNITSKVMPQKIVDQQNTLNEN